MCLPHQQKLTKEEVIVDCVKEGKGGKNLEGKKIMFRWKVKRAKREACRS